MILDDLYNSFSFYLSPLMQLVSKLLTSSCGGQRKTFMYKFLYMKHHSPLWAHANIANSV
jgi:hypothetical protein